MRGPQILGGPTKTLWEWESQTYGGGGSPKTVGVPPRLYGVGDPLKAHKDPIGVEGSPKPLEVPQEPIGSQKAPKSLWGVGGGGEGGSYEVLLGSPPYLGHPSISLWSLGTPPQTPMGVPQRQPSISGAPQSYLDVPPGPYRALQVLEGPTEPL